MAAETLRQESQRLAHHYETVDLSEFFANLLPILTHLARDRQVTFAVEIPPGLPRLRLSYPLLRQIILSLASQSIHDLPLRRMVFLAQVTPQTVAIGFDLTYFRAMVPVLDEVGRQIPDTNDVETMVAALDGRVRWEACDTDRHRLWIIMPRCQEMSVLVVEDKVELFELFQRYLAVQPYQIRHAATVDEGLKMVHADPPDIVLLDLMMPERDGWEFLHNLRKEPDLASIPVIVCSVLHEPNLAFSLGAQHYLKKPVAAEELIQALEQVGWQG
jgi:CheY-like chemotaxis protein